MIVGAPRAAKRYCKLMMRRIKWGDENADEAVENENEVAYCACKA